jgi:hypothetical protein
MKTGATLILGRTARIFSVPVPIKLLMREADKTHEVFKAGIRAERIKARTR